MSSNALAKGKNIPAARIKKSASNYVLNRNSSSIMLGGHSPNQVHTIEPPYVRASLNTLRSQHRLIMSNKNLDMIPKLIREYLESEYLQNDYDSDPLQFSDSNTEPHSGSSSIVSNKNATSASIDPINGSSPEGSSLPSQQVPKIEKQKEDLQLDKEKIRPGTNNNPASLVHHSSNFLNHHRKETSPRKIVEINVSCNRFSLFRFVLPQNLNFTQLHELNIGYNRLTRIPKNIAKRVPNLQRLNVAGNDLTSLPHEMKHLKDLLVLDISENDFSQHYGGKIPTCVQHLKDLRKLNVSHTGIKYLSNSLANLKHLVYLNASKNQIKKVPASLGKLSKLTHLVLFENQIDSIAPEIGKCPIRVLELDHNQLRQIPASLFCMQDLRELYLSNNLLEEFPEIRLENETLQVMEADSNQLTHLPQSFSNLSKLAVLTLARNHLSHFNAKIHAMSDLSLASNHLTSYPEVLLEMPQLLRLNLSYNQITQLDDSVFENCIGLRQLIITGNILQNLPSSIILCKDLEVLLASENEIPKIPHIRKFRQGLQSLAHLSLWGNNLSYHQILRLTAPFDNEAAIVPFPRLRTLHLGRNSTHDSRWNAPVVKQKFLQCVASHQYLGDFEFSSDLSSHMHHVNIGCSPKESIYPFGTAHFQGTYRSTMEDALAIDQLTFEGEPLSMFAVLDGHGGDKVSTYTAKHFSSVLQGIIDKHPRDSNVVTPTFYLERCVVSAVNRITEGLRQLDATRSMTDGSTLVMALIWRRTCIVANVGDSRAVGCTSRGGKAVRLSRDHKASDPIEKKRILEMGGVVDSRERILGLALSRSLGDFDLKPFVTHDPEFCAINLDRVDDTVRIEEIEDQEQSVCITSTPTGCEDTDSDVAVPVDVDSHAFELNYGGYKYIVLACDGVFDVLEDQEVCDHVEKIISARKEVGQKPHPDILDLAAHHVRDYSLCCGSSDNISLIVIAVEEESKPQTSTHGAVISKVA